MFEQLRTVPSGARIVALSVWLPACGASQSAAELTPHSSREASSPQGRALSSDTSVRLLLEASIERIVPHQPFWLLARLTPPPGMHVYWQNPGEAGLATRATFRMPEGYSRSEVQYPGPVSFVSERGAKSYVYAGETALLVSVVGNSSRPTSTFEVTARWLSCGSVCVEEAAEASLTLPRAKQEPARDPVAFEYFVALLPVPDPELEVKWQDENSVVIDGPPNADLLEYFPIEPLGIHDRAPLSKIQENGTLVVEFRHARVIDVHRGVVRARVDGSTRYYEVVFGGGASVTLQDGPAE